MQSYLAGVGTLVLGERDEAGRLVRVDSLPVHSLPGRAAAGGHGWDGGRLLAFGSDVLSWMARCGQQLPEQHLRFAYSGGASPAAGSGGPRRQGQQQQPAAAGTLTCLLLTEPQLPAAALLPARLGEQLGRVR